MTYRIEINLSGYFNGTHKEAFELAQANYKWLAELQDEYCNTIDPLIVMPTDIQVIEVNSILEDEVDRRDDETIRNQDFTPNPF